MSHKVVTVVFLRLHSLDNRESGCILRKMRYRWCHCEINNFLSLQALVPTGTDKDDCLSESLEFMALSTALGSEKIKWRKEPYTVRTIKNIMR